MNSNIDKSSKINSGCNIVNTNMDRHSYCGYNCEIINADIGSFCSIAGHVVIGGSKHPVEWVSTSPVFQDGRNSIKKKYARHITENGKRTVIGSDVWIGENALIKQGVNIGPGAVIGMGSVVTKDVEPFSIVAGAPAKEIRKRFESEVIEKLLLIQWWNFNEEDLLRYAEYFTDPKEFIRKVLQ